MSSPAVPTFINYPTFWQLHLLANYKEILNLANKLVAKHQLIRKGFIELTWKGVGEA